MLFDTRVRYANLKIRENRNISKSKGKFTTMRLDGTTDVEAEKTLLYNYFDKPHSRFSPISFENGGER